MRESVRGQCNFSEKSSGDDIPLYQGYRHPGCDFGPCFLKKAEFFSGATSEGYGSNPTRQPFFRVSEVSDLTAVLRTDSAEVFTP